jgi:hypothetical protein
MHPRHYGRCVQAPGCPEWVAPSFLRWVWDYRRRSRPGVLAAIAEHAGQAEVIVVRSRADARRVLALCGGEPDAERDEGGAGDGVDRPADAAAA